MMALGGWILAVSLQRVPVRELAEVVPAGLQWSQIETFARYSSQTAVGVGDRYTTWWGSGMQRR
jgi:hypothetical protein